MVAVTTTPDAQLVPRAVSGEDQAFTELLRRHTPGLYRYCAGLLGDVNEAEDVVQEASVKAYRSLERSDPRRFRAWFFTIARNLCYDALRRRKTWAPLSGGEEDERRPPLSSVDREALHEALQVLSPKQRTLVHYRYTLGLRTREIAEELGLTPSNVRVSLHRAIRRLREVMS